MAEVSAADLAEEKKLSFCGKLRSKAFNICFGSVMVPAVAFVDNSVLTKLHRFILLLLLAAFAAVVLVGKLYYLKVVPNAYTNWITGSDAGFGTLVTNQLANTGYDFCDSPANNQYAFFLESKGLDFSAKEFACINSSYFGDDELPRGSANGEAFFPTYFAEDWEERKVTTNDCTTLSTSCVPGAQDADAWNDNVPGAKKYTALGQIDGEDTCKCETRPKHFFTTGVEEKILYLRHAMTADDNLSPLTLGVAGLQPEEAEAADAEPLLTIIQFFDKETKQWKEADCSATSWVTQDGEEGEKCRFNKIPGFKMREWLSIAGIGSLDAANKNIGLGNSQNNYVDSVGSTHTLTDKPSYRVSGLQLVVQLKYLDSVYQPPNPEKPWYTETPGQKPDGLWKHGTICYVQVSLNGSYQKREETKLESAPGTPNGSGRARHRNYSGILVSAVGSNDSKFGFVSMALLSSYVAQAVIIVQLAALIVQTIGLYLLGETSRNYNRFLRGHVETTLMAARSTPAKVFCSAVTFCFMREWEEDEVGAATADGKSEGMMKYHLDNDDQISEDTIRMWLHAAFPHALCPDMDEEQIDNMAEAAFVELGGNVDEDDNPLDSIHLLEFVETAVCGEVVDYLASKTAFNPRHKRSFLERKFGDNMRSYASAKKNEQNHHSHRGRLVTKGKLGKLAGMTKKVATLGLAGGNDKVSADSYSTEGSKTVEGDGDPADTEEKSRISTE